jgi:hypothetical protein
MSRRASYFTISEIEQLDEWGHMYSAIEISHGSGHGVDGGLSGRYSVEVAIRRYRTVK